MTPEPTATGDENVAILKHHIRADLSKSRKEAMTGIKKWNTRVLILP
jgi:hypothetical protein